MTENQLAEGSSQEASKAERDLRFKKWSQSVLIVFLLFFWVGYFYSLYQGNQSNVSSYTLMIMSFSLLNAEILFTRKKAQNTALNVIAKIEGALFFLWALATVIFTILK